MPLRNINMTFVGIVCLLGLSCLADTIKNEQLIVSLKVNHVDSNQFSLILKNSKDQILIPFDDIKTFNIKEQYLKSAIINIDNINYISLDSLEGINYTLDLLSVELEIILPASAMNHQYFSNTDFTEAISGKNISGIFINYNLMFSESSNNKYLAGVQEVNYFSEKGVFTNSFMLESQLSKSSYIRNNRQNRNNNVSRLDTYWTFDNLQNMTRLRIGDSVTKAAHWSGSTRFIGVKYATNFSLRPDLITRPLISFSGRAELPTSVDIYEDTINIFKGNVNVGDFDIESFPVINGRGELTARIQDITGKISTIKIPYYTAPNLLKEGLSDFSFESGFQRNNYAIKNNQYKNFLVNYNYIYGVTNKWTTEVHFESLGEFSTIGATNNVQIGNYGVVSVSLASNLRKAKNAQKAMVAYHYQDQRFNFYVNANKNVGNYYDVYDSYDTYNSYGNYDNYYIYNRYNKGSSKLNYQANIGFFDQTIGNISVNFLSSVEGYNRGYRHHRHHYATTRRNIISANYNRPIRQSGYVRFAWGKDLKKANNYNFAYVSLGFNLGNQSISISNSYYNKRNTQQLSLSSISDNIIGWQYNANLIKGRTNDYNIQINRTGERLDNSLYLYKYGNNKTIQLDIRGSIVGLKNRVFFTRPINDALALVKVGEIKDVPVYVDNLVSGYTNKDGEVLIPSVLSYSPSEVRIDDEKLPLNSKLLNSSLNISPKWRSGVMIDFGVSNIRSVEMILVDKNNQDILLGSTVTLNKIKESAFVGYDGKLYISDIGNLDLLEGKACKGEEDCCDFNVSVDKDKNDLILDLGKVICK